jgi:hypothetical protein
MWPHPGVKCRCCKNPISHAPIEIIMLKSLYWILGMSTILSTASAQTNSALARELFEKYENFRMPGITSRRFSQAEMLKWLEPLRDQKLFAMTPVGRSAEGRTISMLKLGSGKTTVFLWSQMHGDESTATMAIMDMLEFFFREPEHIVTRSILEKLNLLIIPMLNPDGAERFQRRTAQSIDMNRDALTLRTPEARILKETRDTYRPQFGFNLHDQDPRYSVGETRNVSAIALLAPAFDESRTDNNVRLPAKKVAATLASVLHEFIPSNVSKYDDAFEPRAFGDNIQKWGTSTVLIESGGWPGDEEKMFIRKLNCVALLTTLHAIAADKCEHADVRLYEQLPFNTKYLYDIIFRNAQLKVNDSVSPVSVDIGINIEQEFNPQTRRGEPAAKVVDIGDLRTYGAFREVDVNGAVLRGAEVKIDQRIPMEKVNALLKKK